MLQVIVLDVDVEIVFHPEDDLWALIITILFHLFAVFLLAFRGVTTVFTVTFT